MAASATSKLLVSDFPSSASHIPSNYVCPISDRPNLSEVETSGDSIPLIDLQELHGSNDRAEIIHQLAISCSTDGFFQKKEEVKSQETTTPLASEFEHKAQISEAEPFVEEQPKELHKKHEEEEENKPSLLDKLHRSNSPSSSSNRVESMEPPTGTLPSPPSCLQRIVGLLTPPPPPPPPPPPLPFLNVAPPHPLNLGNHVPEPHRMDELSWAALVYCFTAGFEFNAILAQVGDPNDVSFRVQLLSLLLNIALWLLIAANGIFARTHPNMALVMDRVGSVIVLLSSVIAAMPTIPLNVSIGCAVCLIILYAHQHFSS